MSLAYAFMAELESIQDSRIRGFTVDALATAPEFYANTSDYIHSTKRTLAFAQSFLRVLDADDYITDLIQSAVFLQDLTRYHLDEDGEIAEDPMHPVTVRQKLVQLINTVGAETFDNILRTVESSHALNSPIPQVIPDVTDPVYMWILPFANQLTKEFPQ